MYERGSRTDERIGSNAPECCDSNTPAQDLVLSDRRMLTDAIAECVRTLAALPATQEPVYVDLQETIVGGQLVATRHRDHKAVA